MLRKLLRYLFLSLVLLLVFFTSALLAMRFAIRGREVRVPSLTGLTPSEAERIANNDGLVLAVDTRYYTPSVPRGHIVSQTPAPGNRVRRGWRVLVAESLGPQRAAIPDLLGQSEHAADINITRHGMEVGSLATMHLPDASPETVVAQSPRANTKDAASPKISLLFSAAENEQAYVMPNFVGRSLVHATTAVENAGLSVGKVWKVTAAPAEDGNPSGVSGIILKQYPPPGQKVTARTVVDFEIRD
ncbi:MAG TPA: PASTA domain-containing protein [Terriglobales bacterium]